MVLNAKTKPDKIKQIAETLQNDPLIKVEEIERNLRQKNFHCSVYEKIFILTS